MASPTLRSKSWSEFAGPDAPRLHFVFTVCDRAAGEVCPIWPGQPMTAHWGFEDPSAVSGSEEVQLRAFHQAFRELDARIKIFTSLRLEHLDRLALQRDLDAIGRARRAWRGRTLRSKSSLVSSGYPATKPFEGEPRNDQKSSENADDRQRSNHQESWPDVEPPGGSR